METAFWILACIALCFTTAYQGNKAKKLQKERDEKEKSFREFETKAMAIEDEHRKKLETVEEINKTLRKHLIEQDENMNILRRTLEKRK